MVIGPTWSASDRSYRARCRISCAASSCIDLETDRAAFHVQRASRASESAYGRDGLPVHAWIPRGTQSFVGDGTSRCESPRKKVQERRESPRAAQPRRKKILAGMMAQSLVFRREDATSEDASTRRSGKPTELGRIRLFPPRHFGRNMRNLKYECCQQPTQRSCEEGNKPIPRCPIITLHRPAPKSAHRNDRAGKGVVMVDGFSTN